MRRYRFLWPLLILSLLLALTGRNRSDVRTLRVAGAKGQTVARHQLIPSTTERLWRDVALADPQVAALLQPDRSDFLYSVILGEGESSVYACTSCRQLTFYDYAAQGVVEVVIDEASGQVVDRWRDPMARPGASPYLVEKVVAIAADDARVTDVLGDIRRASVAMVPMSTWLADDACAEDWCVDLTFHDPSGSGRIFHVVTNLDRQQVARTFFTRGLPEIRYQEAEELDPNAPFFTNGCHEAAGWSVCWEMTGHDGLNLYDASYNGTDIFRSIKIGQVEAYYPSWPGGYRDEIGFASTVPPKFDTRLVTLEDGFQVRQMFTEAFGWPNCVCCYRYEQIVTFYDDGAYEPEFISYGPGCDDLVSYRPFWRIATDLGSQEVAAETWLWDQDGWVQTDTELEVDAFDTVSLDGARLATFDATSHYKWEPIPFDPLGLDDARLFVLARRSGEGDNIIQPGAADTWHPPRQFVNGESLADTSLVIWYVPSLNSLRGGPWWCMPFPEPTPCGSRLLIRPDDALRQPTPEELAALHNPTPTPSPEPAAPAPEPPRLPPTVVEGTTPEEIISNSGCGACHAIGDLGEVGKVGPDLTNIAEVAGERVPGQPAAEYLRNAILYPNIHLVPDCPNGPCMPNIMPGNYYLRLTEAQVDTLVAFMLTQTGAPAASSASPVTPAAGETPAPAVATPAARDDAAGANLEDVPSPVAPVPTGRGAPPPAVWLISAGGALALVLLYALWRRGAAPDVGDGSADALPASQSKSADSDTAESPEEHHE